MKDFFKENKALRHRWESEIVNQFFNHTKEINVNKLCPNMPKPSQTFHFMPFRALTFPNMPKQEIVLAACYNLAERLTKQPFANKTGRQFQQPKFFEVDKL